MLPVDHHAIECFRRPGLPDLLLPVPAVIEMIFQSFRNGKAFLLQIVVCIAFRYQKWKWQKLVGLMVLDDAAALLHGSGEFRLQCCKCQLPVNPGTRLHLFDHLCRLVELFQSAAGRQMFQQAVNGCEDLHSFRDLLCDPCLPFFLCQFLLRQREREPDITVCEGFPDQGDPKNAMLLFHFFCSLPLFCFRFLFPALPFPCFRLFHEVFPSFHISAFCQISPVLLPEPANPCIIYIGLQPLRKL